MYGYCPPIDDTFLNVGWFILKFEGKLKERKHWEMV